MSVTRGIGVGTVAALIAALFVAGASPAYAADPMPGDPLTGDGVGTRTVNTATQLGQTTNPGAVVDSTAGFGVPAYAAPPAHNFEGTLRINNINTTASTGSAEVSRVSGGYQYYNTGDWYRFLPYSGNVGTSNYYLEQQFVQNGSYIIPTDRGLKYLSSLNYNIIWGVGRAWTETADIQSGSPRTRASIPFTLVFKEENCSFYGMLTFLFTDSSISRVRYQVASETCAYFKGNLWGNLAAGYTKSTIANAETIRNDYVAEVANRLPVKPISAIATDYPDAGFDTSAFTSGITAAHITGYGFVYQGVNYVSNCVTRTSNQATNSGGLHPFCDQVTLPSYSTSKSIFMGGALMRLGEKYGASVYDELVKDWVPELASDSSWSDVTFNNLLDMATGHYTSDGYQVDEAGSTMTSFFALANSTRSAKMTYATAFPSKVAPGTKWVYHTSDSFLLAAAMDAYLKSKEGSSADIWSMLYDEVLAPIGVSPDSKAASRTTDSSKLPWGGYGLFWSRDGLAKIGQFYAGGDGSADGVQLLEPGMVDDALQRDAGDRGLPTADSPFLYNNGFWARQYTSADDAAYTAPFYVPFMSGYGGITVALMPNCSAFYMVNDNSEYSWAPVVRESNKLDSMADPECADSGEEPEEPKDATSVAATLSADEQSYGSLPTTVVSAQVSSESSETPEGSVTFRDGATVLASGVEVDGNGQAEYSVDRDLAVGEHPITAEFVPDEDAPFEGSESDPVTLTVVRATSSVALELGASTQSYQTSAPVEASVAVTASDGRPAAGEVVIREGGTDVAGPATLSGGEATITLPADLSAGAHDLTAVFLPADEASYADSVSSSVTLTVVKMGTSLDLTLGSAEQVYGDGGTATVTVEDEAGNPVAGMVSLREGSTVLGTGTTTDVDGTVTIDLPDLLAIGTHSITAVFSPDASGDYSGSSSAARVLTVRAVGTETSVSFATSQPYGQIHLVSVQVTPQTAVPVAGTVVVFRGANVVATKKVDAGGVITVKLSKTMKVGSYSFVAAFLPAPDSGLKGSVSDSTAITVTKAVSSVSFSVVKSLTASKKNGAIRVTISVIGTKPTGNVRILDGEKVIKRVTLTAAKNGKIVITVPKLKRGEHLITVTYGGSAKVGAGSSAQRTFEVK